MNLGDQLRQQTTTLWALCENFEGLVFKLGTLIPNAQASETNRELMVINDQQQSLAKRIRATLTHLRFLLTSHTLGTKIPDSLTHPFLQEIKTALANRPAIQSFDLDVPIDDVLTQLETNITAQHLAGLRSLVIRLEMALLAGQPPETKPYTAGSLYHDRQFLVNLMQYDAYPHDYPQVDAPTFLTWLAYRRTGVLIDSAVVYNLRTEISEAAPTGLSGGAYCLKVGEQVEGYLVYRGAERTGQAGEWAETALDWQYMLKSILLAQDNREDQLPYARRFAQYTLAQLKQDNVPAALYGVGHSLGGQLVQAVQLLDHPFTAGLTINTVPVQLRQLRHAAPKRFSTQEWHALAQTNALQSETTMPEMHITNLRFNRDFTDLFYQVPGTICVGRTISYSIPDWHYPFTANLKAFFTETELQSLLDILRYGMVRFDRASTQTQLINQVVALVIDTLITFYRTASTKATITLFNHLNRYLYHCGFLTEKPESMHYSSRKHRALRQLLTNVMLQRHYLKHLNKGMFAAVINFHIVNGVKFMITDERAGVPIVEVGRQDAPVAAVLDEVLPDDPLIEVAD
ncbi:DUF6792 domain-containing protein [Lacticaseibacillus brantae]|uniref:DUF6792 domain-containing protein n=1 Tax=Lacticaseibacillus brantae DSM 23927 TaxID=1423727 RepID=A0A0R2B0X8_9LACO|nr:DUF6792 domain-containing protein [Lacticaseibacillus brantae]KRM72418.1 hypothetical protein FC34_GL000121 [Lacticaseibacillus brantae DSM 23927]